MNTSRPAALSESAAPDPLDEAERALGGRSAMARTLEVTPGAIGNWKVRGVPIKKCVRIEQLVPAVTRARLRPHDFAEVWPDLLTKPTLLCAQSTGAVNNDGEPAQLDRCDPATSSPYVGTDIDRRAPALRALPLGEAIADETEQSNVAVQGEG